MKISEHKLKNGIKVVLAKIPGAEMVSINVFIGTGARYETPSLYGISHFLEHMLFKGTPTYPSASLFTGAIERVGGKQNAWTSEDNTMFWNMVPSKHLELAIKSLAEQVTCPLLNPDEIDKERGTVIEEIKRGHDDPYLTLLHSINKTLWPNQPLECDVLGREANIKRISQKKFQDYMDKHYHAGNMIISVASNLPESKIMPLLEKEFGKIKKKEKIEARPVRISQNKSNTVLIPKGIGQAHLALCYHTFGHNDKRKAALDVLMAILGGGMSSILFVELREKRGLTYVLEVGVDYMSDCGFTYIYGGFNKNKAEAAIKVIKKEILNAAKHEYDDEKIAQAKEYLKGNLLFNVDGLRNISTRLGETKLLRPKEVDYHQVIKNIESVTKKDVRRVAEAIFSPSNENLIIHGPYKNKEKFAKILAHKEDK